MKVHELMDILANCNSLADVVLEKDTPFMCDYTVDIEMVSPTCIQKQHAATLVTIHGVDE